MPKQSRAEIDARIDTLERELPGMLASTRPEDHSDAFAGVADEILEDAADEDREHAWSRLQCLLRDNGLIPGDDLPCED